MQRPTLFDRRPAGASISNAPWLGALVLMAVVLLTTAVAALAVTFTGHDIATAYGGAHSIVAADIDGDTDLDVLTTAVTLDDLSWWENDGSEQFVKHTVDAALDGARDAISVDVDGDTDMDIVAAADRAGDIVWYENDGSASFTKHLVDGLFYGAHAVCALDVDGDTDIDIVAAATAGSVAWWENNGSESFTRHTIDAAFDGARDVTALDIDGDTDIDIAAVALDADDVAWYENDGSGAFTKHLVDVAFNGASSIAAADIDGDTDVDLLASATQADYIAWFENNGSQSFTRRYVVGYFNGATAVDAADIDGDGDMDVVGAAFRADMIAWFENNGSEIFTRHTLVTGYDEARAVYVADVDGDSDLDILGTAATAGKASWWEQEGTPSNQTPELVWTGEPGYENDGLEPETGTPADTYVYRIRYRDADGDAPGFVRVHVQQNSAEIAGSPFTLSCDVGDAAVGIVCSYAKDGLEAGSGYSYLFAAADVHGLAAAAPPEQFAPLVEPPANRAPELVWTGEPGYENDGLEPETGAPADTYVYRIRYRDADGDAPDFVLVRIRQNSAEIAGSPFTLSCDAGDVAVGVVCSFAKDGLETGSGYSYLFAAADVHGLAAAAPPEQFAPLVEPPANSPPTLAWTGEPGYEDNGLHPESGTTATTFSFRIRYADADGDAPGGVWLHLQRGGVDVAGSPFALDCPAGDATAGIVCSIALTDLAADQDYTHWFTAVDSAGNGAAPTAMHNAPAVLALRTILIPLLLTEETAAMP